MMAYIMLGPTGIFDFFLQIFILYSLHGELMVLFLQLKRFALLQDQSGDNIVNQKCSHIDNKEKN